jgi:NADPH-dependent ferric siderophore reductase
MDHTLPTRRAGRIESALQKLFTRSAEVLAIEQVSDHFRLLTLGGDALREASWTPGDKIQIQLGGWVQRTYTPLDWDHENGRTRVLVYLHADGPGTHWARALREGDSCVIFGPRKSIRLEGPPAPVPLIFFGDETSLGLAVALARQAPLQILLEAGVAAESAAVLRHFGLHDAQVCTRSAQDAHFTELAARMLALLQAQPSAEVVLTGRAGALQHLSRLLRRQGVTGRRQSKAYWAAGKSGLD